MQVRIFSIFLAFLMSFNVNAQMFNAQMGLSAGINPMMMGGGIGANGGQWGTGAYGAQNCAYPTSYASGIAEDSDTLRISGRSLTKAKKDLAKEEARKLKLKDQMSKTRKNITAVLQGPAANLVFRHMDGGKNRDDQEYAEACGQAPSAGTSERPIVVQPDQQPAASPSQAVQPEPTSSNAKLPAGRLPAQATPEFYCLQNSKKNNGQPGYINLWGKYAQDGGSVDSSICFETYTGITKSSASADKRSDCQSSLDEYLSLKGEIDENSANIRALKDQIKNLEKLISAETDRLEADVEGPAEGGCTECAILRRQSRYKPSTGEVIGGVVTALAGAGLTAWGMATAAQRNSQAGYPTNPLVMAMPGLGLLAGGVYGAVNGGMAGGAYGCAGGGPFGQAAGGPFGAPGVLPMMNGGAMLPGAVGGSPFSPYGGMMNPMMGMGGYPGMGMGGMSPMMGIGLGVPGLTGYPMMQPGYGMPYGGQLPNMMAMGGYPMMGIGGYPGMMNGMMGPSVLPMMNGMGGYPMMGMGGYPGMMNPMMGGYPGGMNGMYNPMMGGMNPLGGMQYQMQIAQMQMAQMQQQQQYMQQVYQQQMYKQNAVASIQQQIYSLQMQMYQISAGSGPSVLPYPGPGYGGTGMGVGYGLGVGIGGYSTYGGLGMGMGGGYYNQAPSVLPYPGPGYGGGYPYGR